MKLFSKEVDKRLSVYIKTSITGNELVDQYIYSVDCVGEDFRRKLKDGVSAEDYDQIVVTHR